ncbi:hypothetical protein D9619_006678 [Psilocybe cf. subviscida]|uniref:non-specific serine/threonine protein kinase n=1 Tax=Psilocybe cf. subviscida TaxID=2480587 RepID=A0A8H5B4U5_9AGAR|nr:hypothetical protein D9619_006678 [Psilocybe cf. subviscida]
MYSNPTTFTGHVRIARHSKTGQYAAIKIISKGALASRVSLNRLADEVEHTLLAVEREIVVMKLIDHPNIMKLYDVWETSTSLYLILEYVQGGELFDYLCSKGRRPLDEVVDYFQQIICAVDYCHRFNIAHRDLKLENILIDQESNIKVADFGMATWQDNSRGKLLRTSCGSPHYAAPEIISGQPYDGTISDIWSCGIILYALLAAKLPFDDDDCPTLLRKISIGRFEMPADISPDAQDLISRMLTIDVKKRITMQEIMHHPFFRSRPLKNPLAMPSDLNMTTFARPIGSRSQIDPDIFANLRTLWHGTPDSELIESLLDSDRNWQKGIYHLLVIYRNRTTNHNQEEERQIQMSLERRKSRQAQRKLRPSESVLHLRTGAPTPRRGRHRDCIPMVSSEESLVHVHYPLEDPPVISLSAPSPQKRTGELSIIAPPHVEDAKVQVFFEQIANHLNVLQAKNGNTPASPRSGYSNDSASGEFPPVLNVDGIPATPRNIRGLSLNIENMNINEVGTGLPLDHSTPGTKPLTVRRKNRPPTLTVNNKENALPITESDILNKQSPLTRHGAKLQDGRQVQDPMALFQRLSPVEDNSVASKPPSSPMFSEAGSSFMLPSPIHPPKRSWLDNVFKFKPATYCLLSRYDIHTTRNECRRLLVEMDMLVSLEGSDKLGLLKCRSNDIKDANNIMLGLKAVKFRVEMQWPSAQLCSDGYLVSLVFVQEKGPLDVFKAIFAQLEQIWTLGGQHPDRIWVQSPHSGHSSLGERPYMFR